jgi:hypothetical protein
MGRRAVYIALLAVVGLFLYLGYNSYDAKRAGATGEVYSPTGKVKTEPVVSPAAEQRVVEPVTTTVQTTPEVTVAAAPVPSETAQMTQGGTQVSTAGIPGGDTIHPNPPNGMVFSGSGKYQLYRQGNITWRLDTATGRTCVVFATEEEWKKPQVYRNGCGKR